MVHIPEYELLRTKGWGWSFQIGELAQKVVELQLSTFNEHAAKATVEATKADSLFDAAALKIAESIGDDPEEDIKAIGSIPHTVVRRAIWRWIKLPYPAFCALNNSLADEEPPNKRPRTESDNEYLPDVDEWCVCASF